MPSEETAVRRRSWAEAFEVYLHPREKPAIQPNYLQHEAIGAQLEMASSPNHTTVYIPVGNNGLPLVHMPER